MWPFEKKVKRRLEVRKTMQAAGPSRWAHFRQAGGVGALLLAGLLFAGVLAMDAWPVNSPPYRIGQYLPSDIHARVGFEIPSPERREDDIDTARRETPATFLLDEKRGEAIVAELVSFPKTLKATTQPDSLPEKLRERLGLTDEEGIKPWLALAQPDRWGKYVEQIRRLEARLRQTCTVRPDELATQQERGAKTFVSGEQGAPQSIYALIALNDAEKIEYEAARLSRIVDKPVRESLKNYLVAALSEAPLYAYDAAASRQRLNEALKAIDADPPTRTYAVAERLARRSSRAGPDGQEVRGLSETEYQRLRKEHETYSRARGRHTAAGLLLVVAGRAAILLLVMVPLCVYVVRYEPRIVRNRWRGLAVVGVLLGMLALNRTMASVLGLNPHVAVLPVMLAAIMMTIAYDQRFALATGAAMAILAVLQLRAGIEVLVVLLVAVAASIFPLREIRMRSKLITVAGLSAGVVAAAVGAMGLANDVPWRFVLFDALWGAGFALLVGFLVQGILPVIERMFGVATSMTLLEWCDASKPLLKRLAMEAPGTYNHSLQLGAMCEAAAEAVDGRGLLARVGAYYHDIGKINKPDYFVENQPGAANKHEKLSPAMSLLIIIGHVKDGLEMARECGLPKVLHEFISTHHGTTLVQYFYQVASEQRKDDNDRAPEEVEFRYPGPKPQSSESAILMLADAAESSVRAMSEPTPGRIENQVHTMVNRRLMDGQLDQCELTLKAVHKIEASLIKSLCGVYHARIAYPTPAGEKPAAAEIDRTGNGRDAGADDAPAPEGPDRADIRR